MVLENASTDTERSVYRYRTPVAVVLATPLPWLVGGTATRTPAEGRVGTPLELAVGSVVAITVRSHRVRLGRYPREDETGGPEAVAYANAAV
jgi:hypothetical protein